MPNSAWQIINLTTSKPPDKAPHTSDCEPVSNATKSFAPWGSSCQNNYVLEGSWMQRESLPKTIVLRTALFLWVAMGKFGNLLPCFLIGLGISPALQLLLWKWNSRLDQRRIHLVNVIHSNQLVKVIQSSSVKTELGKTVLSNEFKFIHYCTYILAQARIG